MQQGQGVREFFLAAQCGLQALSRGVGLLSGHVCRCIMFITFIFSLLLYVLFSFNFQILCKCCYLLFWGKFHILPGAKPAHQGIRHQKFTG